MSSKLSESICETYFNNSEGELLRDVIDAELQEVREVLNLFAEEWMTPHDYEHEIEFLPKDVKCDQCDLSKRTRALMEKLKP